MSAPSTKTCPDCAEEIKSEARVCRYCGYRFDEQDDAHRPADGPDAATTSPTPFMPDNTDSGRLAATAAKPGRGRSGWLLGLIYAVAVTLWIISVIPLAAETADGDSGTEVASGFVAAILVSLGVAALVRLVYAGFRHRPFLSPWLFVIAAVIAFFSFAGQNARETEATDRAAVERGVAESADEVTPVQRCVTRALEALETASSDQRAAIRGDGRSFFSRICTTAEREGNLAAEGDIYASDAFKITACREIVLIDFDRIPRAERAFTRANFAVFARRYCEVASSRGLIEFGTAPRRLEALQQEVLNDLLESGRIERLP